MNGLGSQGGPRGAAVPNPVTYPFQSPIHSNVTVCQQVSGQRTFDINTDGVAHYGLYADWMQDLKMIAGQQIIDDMARGAEAYLRMWERTTGVLAGRGRRRAEPLAPDPRTASRRRPTAAARRAMPGCRRQWRRARRVRMPQLAGQDQGRRHRLHASPRQRSRPGAASGGRAREQGQGVALVRARSQAPAAQGEEGQAAARARPRRSGRWSASSTPTSASCWR